MNFDDERSAGLALDTGLKVPTIRRLAAEAATASRGFGFRRGMLFAGSVSLTHEAARGLTLQVLALSKTPLLKFLVLNNDAGNGRTRIEVTLRDHLTTRAVGPAAVPVDRRRVAGIETYRRFLDAFARKIRDADPSTTILRPGSTQAR